MFSRDVLERILPIIVGGGAIKKPLELSVLAASRSAARRLVSDDVDEEADAMRSRPSCLVGIGGGGGFSPSSSAALLLAPAALLPLLLPDPLLAPPLLAAEGRREDVHVTGEP